MSTVGQAPHPARVTTRRVHLPDRGSTQVWECAGPPEAPAVILVHGAALTGELNWAHTLPVLARRFRVVAFDQRGHGEGIPAGPAWRLEDCADDVAALANALGINQFIAVGYSMGGTVAQLLHRRHPHRLRGLVLCSTARNARGSVADQAFSLALPAFAASLRWNPVAQVLLAQSLTHHLLGTADARTLAWAVQRLRRTQIMTALAVMQAVYEFTSHTWIGDVRVPTAVVVTSRDRVVPPARQRKLALAIPGSLVFELDADHGAFVTARDAFARMVAKACLAVDARAGERSAGADGAATSHVESAVDAPHLPGDV